MGDIADMYGEDAIYNGTFDGDMNPGYLTAPGGWRVGPSPELIRAAGQGLVIQRGGIKYPTPKGNAMPRTKQQELAATNKEIEGLLAKRERLAREIREATDKPCPPDDQNRWAIDVRFNKGGTLYTYLVMRHGRRYYTTGTGDTGVFNTWKDFLRWLDNDIAEHSALIPLRADYGVRAPLEGKKS